ncbi:aldo/keto reductase [Isoptericola halotolerans]|uniref:2,5-diketo-D-gluconate reductase A n=1 Tax=Isoptericola halotolerans TaxID=300560 RepID=A0ABX2A6U2_9MICO|nr:aldo/keto reductase [Isoptericola halotolerans]NOV97517.1 2,5-diketo-D-gluconate reductase A [Isoptericola halotolerans]
MSTTAPTITLSHGARMPLLGLGTWPMDDAESAVAVRTAIESGYRSIDTAENYGNERGVGRGVRDAGIDRSELFLTTKFNKRWHSVEGARQACEASLERLGVDYLDLLLIHWPNPGQDRYVEAWQGLVRLLEDGVVRAVGTSNFKPAHLQRLLDATGVAPDVNQINLNPYATRDATVAFGTDHGIVTEAWSPLKPATMLDDPAITQIATTHGATPAQVVLRWVTQRGLVTVPKSSSPERQRENLAALDLELTADELATISALDRGEAHVTDSDEFGH